MSVYIDDYQASFGRMVMCHMIADSTEELYQMVDRIGVQRRWVQKKDTYREHFDICLSKRKLALNNGAISISPKELVAKMKSKILCQY